MDKLHQIQVMHRQGQGIKTIARNLSLSKNTVKRYLQSWSESQESDPLVSLTLSRNAQQERLSILQNLFADFDTLLKQPGHTLEFLWKRYKTNYPDGYSYSQFCYHYSHYRLPSESVMHFEHAYGDKLFIDYAGKKLSYVHRGSGEFVECDFFACVLGGSQYTYCEATASQQKDEFINSVENALHYYSGVPQVLVPDNLKSAVTKSSRYDPTLNDDFLGMATHYNCSVMPARALRPRDKAMIERYINILYTRVYAELSGQTFFSLSELNQAIRICLEKHNTNPFQKKSCNRKELFIQHEKELLKPLPANRYEVKEYAQATVMKSSHVLFGKEKHYYSVPYRYIGKKVKIAVSLSQVEIYDKQERIAVHLRDKTPHKYTTIAQHLPSTHQYVSEWSPEKFIGWAGKIDPIVKEYITRIFEQPKYPEILYRSCSGILQLAKKVSKERLVAACQTGLQCKCYNYAFIRRVLKNNTENINLSPQDVPEIEHENIRGADYYQSNNI